MSIKKKIYYIIDIILLLAQTVVSVMLIISLFRMDILEAWINWLVVAGLTILLIICALPLFFKKKKFTAWRVIDIIISIIIIAAGIFALRYTDSLNGLFDKITGSNTSAQTEIDITKDPFIVYISGSDSHTSVDDPNARSDVNIITVVNPAKSKILFVSIPRDTYVQLHGTTGYKDKLTHAGYNNNTDLSKQTLEDFLEIKIDYIVKVSFDTVVNIVDELDGIDIYSDRSMVLGAESKTVKNKICTYTVGTQHVDGDCALRFARERKSYSTGDKHRGENQQQVLTVILNKFLNSRNYLLKLPSILNIVSDTFETSFSRDDITKFIRNQLNNRIDWQMESISLNGVGDLLPTYTYGDSEKLWVMLPDEDSLAEIKSKINENLEKD